MMQKIKLTYAGQRGQMVRGLALGALCLGALFLTAGCERNTDRLFAHEADGQTVFFRATASAVDRRTSRADFTVTVRDVSQSLAGAREAGRFEGTKYCIANFGNSRIRWSVGPDTAPEHLRIVDDRLSFAGRCDP